MQFIDKLNQATDNKYEFLRISKLNLDKGMSSLSVVCLLPEDISDDKFTDDDKKVVEEFCRSQVPEAFALKISFVKNRLNKEAILRQVIAFISSKYQTLTTQYDASLTQITFDGKKIVVDLYMSSPVLHYCENSGFKDKLSKFIYSQNCCDKVLVKINVSHVVDTDKLLQERESVQYVDMGEIEIKGDYHYLVGKEIGRNPRYIDKYKKEMDGICVSGTVSDVKRVNIVDKNSPDRRLKKVLFKFTIDDTTGKMDCLYFAKLRKPKKHEDDHGIGFVTCLDLLADGDDVVIYGNYRRSDFSGKNELLVLKLALCKINYESMAKRREDIKKANKIKVFQAPQKYEVDVNENLLDMIWHCDYILNNKFVIFDLETTGTNTDTDAIIEIGAVKLEYGKIVEYYNTLVDPNRPIPLGASEVNHIYDSDVVNAPYIEDVLGYFIDYVKGYKLIAHNGNGFDFKILRRDCLKYNIEFKNELIDSLVEARRILTNTRSHSLESLCRHYNIVNRNAHRAYEDAEATAKVFVKLMDDSYSKENNN
ncbi:MAG: 3'-5' exonuclease [Clostridia bacterium]|nr:3'-5' exonuclease [Clostridia bacterium]MDE7328656.1 3'-5' exonuclease [Clostridia bacterium]